MDWFGWLVVLLCVYLVCKAFTVVGVVYLGTKLAKEMDEEEARSAPN